nr:hypothetical protein CFP56_09053 [Quercus suber]
MQKMTQVEVLVVEGCYTIAQPADAVVQRDACTATDDCRNHRQTYSCWSSAQMTTHRLCHRKGRDGATC